MQNTLVLSVSQLNRYIKMNFDADENLANIFISGEISNFTNHYRTGHLYFTLKDDSAAVRAVMFNSSAKRLKFMPEDGMKVIARGRVSVYEASGQYQLYVDDMQPDGVGALNLAYEQLKEKLQKEGLFSEHHKKPLPPYPEKVGVITSPTGAAVRDIINVLGRRFPYAEIVFCPVLVQGEGAHLQLTDAVNLFNSERAADVIIIGRGGGSIEDLWEFNDEGLARAVYNSEIPVISAVGHETDFTICDFVADMRAPTPSAAAELAVPDANELQYALSALKNRMFLNVSSGIADRRSRLEYLTSKGALKSPDEMLSNRSQRLDTAFSKMLSSYENRIGGKKVEFISAATALSKLDPMSVLMRGFAFVSDKNGKMYTRRRHLRRVIKSMSDFTTALPFVRLRR